MGDIHDPTFWDENADYRNQVTDFTEFYSEQAWRIATVAAGSKVLDVAAGGGALSRIASRNGAEVLATDFSSGMVEAIASLHLSGVTARVMDGQALDLADNSFDAAFSMFGIMLFPDWRKGLTELVRVLRPGGTACVGTWKDKDGAAANLLLARIAERKFPDLSVPEPAPGMVEWADRRRFTAALEDAGLMNVHFHEVSSDFRIDRTMLLDPERLFQFSPIWPLLSQTDKAELLAELRDHAQRDGDRVIVPSPAVIAVGMKATS